jgi:hypothetical protein
MHVYDRVTEVYYRQPCPTALAAEGESARANFSPTGDKILWYVPGLQQPIVLENPLR